VIGAIGRLEAMTEINNLKFEVLPGTLVSRMDIHKAKTEAMQKKTDANPKEMKASQEHVKEGKMNDLETQVDCLACCIDVNEEKAEA
jgi:hypothetical protein